MAANGVKKCTSTAATAVVSGTSATLHQLEPTASNSGKSEDIMAKEADLQSKIIKWLKSQKCYVIKIPAQPGVPAGCPDIAFFKEGFYGFIEVKSSKTAKFQPLQKETVAKLDEWSWARVAYPENWDTLQKELVLLLKD